MPLGPAYQLDIVGGLDHVGGEGEGTAKAFFGIVEMTLRKLRRSQLADNGGIVRFQRGCAMQARNRLVEPLPILEEPAQIGVGIGEIRIERDGAAEAFDR